MNVRSVACLRIVLPSGGIFFDERTSLVVSETQPGIPTARSCYTFRSAFQCYSLSVPGGNGFSRCSPVAERTSLRLQVLSGYTRVDHRGLQWAHTCIGYSHAFPVLQTLCQFLDPPRRIASREIFLCPLHANNFLRPSSCISSKTDLVPFW